MAGSSAPSCNYEEYSAHVKKHKPQTEMEINSIYRYYDDVLEREYFWYHCTHKIMEGKTLKATCYVPHIGTCKEFPPTDEFIYNKKNLDRLKAHFVKGTNFYFVRNGGAPTSRITRQQFMEHERPVITASFNTVKFDVTDLTKAMTDATSMAVEAKATREKRDKA